MADKPIGEGAGAVTSGQRKLKDTQDARKVPQVKGNPVNISKGKK